MFPIALQHWVMNALPHYYFSFVFRVIHPVKYFNDYVSQKLRPDGRSFMDLRNIKLNINSIKTADASTIVKCGNTTVVCGIKLVCYQYLLIHFFIYQTTKFNLSCELQELAKPKAEEPDLGFIVTNVEFPALCSPKFRPGPPSDYAQITSNLISDILRNSKYIDLMDLCIVKDKLAWVVHCDMICIDYDGSSVDACLMGLIAALKTCKFLFF